MGAVMVGVGGGERGGQWAPRVSPRSFIESLAFFVDQAYPLVMDLQDELRVVSEALAEAEGEHAKLTARIAGLRAQRESLQLAMGNVGQRVSVSSTSPVSPEAVDLRLLTKTDAIVHVLKQADRLMTIDEIVSALKVSGRTEENYGGVAATLQYLMGLNRIQRPKRGCYTAA